MIDLTVSQLAQWAGVLYPVSRFEVDWEGVVEQVGSRLPSDYRELIENFGGGSFDRHIWIYAPRCDGRPYDLVTGVAEREGALRILWDAGEDVPSWLDAHRDRLIVWAATGDGEYIYWWAAHEEEDADKWPIAVQDLDGDWEVFDMSCSEFLTAWVRGQLQTELISTTFANFGNSFTRYDGLALS
ncbi:SMI1/KNR4 family protein [Streptomyces sp. NPDC003393]